MKENELINDSLDSLKNCLQNYGIADDEYASLKENIRFVTFKKGENIFKQGAFIAYIVFLNEGLSKLFVEGQNEKNVIVKFCVSGEFIGFPVLANDNFYPFSAVALKRTTVALIKKESLTQILSKNNNFSNNIIKWYCTDYQFIFNKLSVIGTKNMHGRFADSLLYITEPQHLEEEIFKFLSRRDIADLSGMSMESMVKLLNEFKSDKLISVEGKEIVLSDREMIKRLSRLG